MLDLGPREHDLRSLNKDTLLRRFRIRFNSTSQLLSTSQPAAHAGRLFLCQDRMWPFTSKAPVEAKSLAEPSPELLALFGAAPQASFAASRSEALATPAVQSCIRLISEAAASLDIKVVRRVSGTDAEATDHPVARLLADAPNGWTSTYELVRDLVASALVNDEGGLAWVNRPAGRVAEIVQYERTCITVDRDASTGEPSYRLLGRPVPAGDIVHVRGAFSRSPLSLAAEAIGVAKTMERHAGRLFRDGARPSGVLSIKDLNAQNLPAARAAWEAAHGNGQTGRTAILPGDAKYEQLTLASTDAQFLELRKFQILEICRAFRVPPSMIYDMDRATWSNSEQMGREFLTYTLEPWLRALESALRRALFTDDERPEYFIRFDRDDLTRADLTARATAISSLISSRVLNPNEARSWLDLAPREGGDEYANPNTGSSQPGDAQAVPEPQDNNESPPDRDEILG